MKKKELWEDLKFELESTKLNKLEDIKEKKLILGVGSQEADILFIADDPGLYEAEEFKFTPSSTGEFFFRLCDIADLSLEKYYLTNLSKCVLKWRELSEVEKNHMKDYLDIQIALIKPKIIVTLGQEVTGVVLGKEIKISSERGRVRDYIGGIKLMPTFDPDYVKRSRDLGGKKAKPALEFWNDLKTIKDVIED